MAERTEVSVRNVPVVKTEVLEDRRLYLDSEPQVYPEPKDNRTSMDDDSIALPSSEIGNYTNFVPEEPVHNFLDNSLENPSTWAETRYP